MPIQTCQDRHNEYFSALPVFDSSLTSSSSSSTADSAYHAEFEGESSYHVEFKRDSVHHAESELDSAYYAESELDSAYHTELMRDSAHHAESELDSAYYAESELDSAHHTELMRDSAYYAESELDFAYHALVDKLITSLNLDGDCQEEPIVRDVQPTRTTGSPSLESEEVESNDLLCPLNFVGACHNEKECDFLHGTKCDVCKMAKLHPRNKRQRERHERACIAEHENQSQDMECGICQENVMSKEDLYPDKRFGILESCNHCFCSSCLVQWRLNVNETVERNKTCPMCRTFSGNFILYKYWTERPDEKRQLLKNFDEELEQTKEFRILNLFLFLASFEDNL